MDCQTRRILARQICRTQRRHDKLLQAMAQGAQNTTFCEFGETVHYMIQDVGLQGKPEKRFFTGIWLGKDTHTNESVLGIPGKITARTVRRQVAPEKYNGQLMDTINVYPWNPTKHTVAAPSFMPLPRTTGTPQAQATETGTQTIEIQEALDAPTTQAQPSLSTPTTR